MKGIRYCTLCVNVCVLPSHFRAQEEREREAQLRGPPKISRDEAATRIQKVRERERRERGEERERESYLYM